MGSYNVACSVSNLSLNCGDPAVYIPLEINKYPNKIGDGNHSLIYPHCFYSPVTLPLFGVYDDYGRLDLTEDENLKLVKEHFKIGDSEEIFNYEVDAFKSGMFIHRKVYDALSSVYYEDYSGKEVNDEDYYKDEDDMGFKGQQRRLRETIKDAEESIKMWEGVLEEGSKTLDEKEIQDSIDYYKNMPYWDRSAIGGGTLFSFRDYSTFNAIYQPQILEGKFEEELSTFRKFVGGMFGANVFFFPAMNGCQHGNPYMSRVLYKTALDIAEETIKKQGEY